MCHWGASDQAWGHRRLIYHDLVRVISRIKILNVSTVTFRRRRLVLLSLEIIIYESAWCLVRAHHIAMHHVAVFGILPIVTFVWRLRSLDWFALWHWISYGLLVGSWKALGWSSLLHRVLLTLHLIWRDHNYWSNGAWALSISTFLISVHTVQIVIFLTSVTIITSLIRAVVLNRGPLGCCLLYTSDAADE